MNNNNNTETRLHNRPDEITQDGGGAQAEPWVSVRSAHSRQRNIRTGQDLVGLISPAPESEIPPTKHPNSCETATRPQSRPTQPEAEDTSNEGRSGARKAIEIPKTTENTQENSESEMNESEESDTDSEEEFQEEDVPQPTPTPKQLLSKRNMEGPKPGIKIASLNMRGRAATTGDLKGKDKIETILKWMSHHRIKILALIDTHWNKEYEETLQNKYHKYNFLCENESTHRGGIAFVIDEKKANFEAKIQTITPGRSALLTVNMKGQKIKIATIYAPPDEPAKTEAIKALRKELRKCEDRNEIIITGDWNMVEDEMDRSPQNEDRRTVRKEMKKLKTSLDLVDGWRNSHEEEIDFTWEGKYQQEPIFARIDRIYAPKRIMNRMNEWEINRIEREISDHHAVSVKVLEPDPPFIGKGEWRIKLNTMEHPHFKWEATTLIENLQRNIRKYDELIAKDPLKENRTIAIRKTKNPQIAWGKYKEGIRRAAKEVENIERKNIKRENLELDRESRRIRAKLQREGNETTRKNLRKQLSDTEKKISELTAKRRQKANETVAAKWFKADEKATKLWFSLNKDSAERQIIHSLYEPNTRDPNEPCETRNTDKMMEVARCYHENLQAEQAMTEERSKALEVVLKSTKNRSAEVEMETLEQDISEIEISLAIARAKTGKAPGCDGIPSEFWKQEMEWHKEARKNKENRPNIANILTKVLRDIGKYGPIDKSFAEGRMSLLYKKKDKRDIANYRPITLLNTDYKIYTSILTDKLKNIAPMLINPDQAGFMPKRSIYNQTKLIELTIKLCENEERNGIILALDQEKAYDRIDHTYLWKVMKAFGIPESFTQKVKNIYGSAETAIRINGCTSPAFPVRRGVRQGDPLSCLLYNIAIEPLFEMIRESTIEGIKIHPNSPNAKLSAYADDTTAFMSITDDPRILMENIDIFCKASTAKFNTEKTEIIPIGSPDFRRQIERTRAFNGWNIPTEIKIAREHESVRILGSWQGNHISTTSKWDEIIEKQTKITKLWAKSHPTTLARVRISKALVISRAIYLMTVNGINKEHLDSMEKLVRNFIWNGKKGNIAWEKAIQRRENGGINAPSVKLIYEATKVLWLKKWLHPNTDRPKWAWAANAILEGITQTKPPVAPTAITEWVLQTWSEKGNAEEIPHSLRQMLKAARKYNVKISVTQPPTELKMKMPAFFHPGAKSNRLNNTREARCLRENHGVKNVADLMKIEHTIELDNTENETEHKKCVAHAKRILNNLCELWCPEKRTQDTVTEDQREDENGNNEEEVRSEDDGVIFTQASWDGTSPLENIRIFGERTGYLHRNKTTETPKNPLRVRKLKRGERTDIQPQTVYVSGSVKKSGWENSLAGIGLWYESHCEKNQNIKLLGTAHTKLYTELAAILVALKTHPNEKLTIITESPNSIEAICHKSRQWGEKGWYRVKNTEIMMNIIHELQTRPNTCQFINGEGDPKNEVRTKAIEEARKLANKGIESNKSFQVPRRNHENSRAIYDGAKLSNLEMKDIYGIMIKQTTKDENIVNAEKIDAVKEKIEVETGLRPTTDRLISGIWKLETPARAKECIWNLLIGRTKCGKYWNHIEGYTDRAYCSACNIEGVQGMIETENHLWTECERNGQKEAWKTAKEIWYKTTKVRWPNINIELIQGVGALTLTKTEPETTKRLQTLIVMTMWAIWKTRNERTIQGKHTPAKETAETLKNLLKEYIKKQWGSTKFAKNKIKQMNYIRELWGNDTVVKLVEGQAPCFGF